MRIFQIKFLEKIKTHIYVFNLCLSKSLLLWDNVEKCCTATQASDDNTISRRKDAICISDN